MTENVTPMPALPHLDQLGYVVTDLRVAVAHWLDVFAVGPWFLMHDVAIEGAYEGDEPHTIAMSVAFSYVGESQIELIEPRGAGESPYREFADRHGGSGLHHVARFTHDIDGDLARIRPSRPAHERLFLASAGPMRLAYVEGSPRGAPVLELLDVTSSKPMFDDMLEAARTWDGRDPVRILPLA